MTREEAKNILCADSTKCGDCAYNDRKIRKCAMWECEYAKAVMMACKSLEALSEIDSIINDTGRIQEDVFRYKMICSVMEGVKE